MYPYIIFGGLSVSMDGLGIVISFFVFLATMRFMTQKYKLSFLRFFLSLPVFIIATYVLGKYFTLLLNYNIVFPFDSVSLSFLFDTSNFALNYIGIIVGGIFYVAYFFHVKFVRPYQDQRIDSFFMATSVAIIPLGLFLLLGDTFVGRVTDGIVSVQALTTQSSLAKFSSVYPLGLFLSGAGFLSLLIKKKADRSNGSGNGYLGFALLFFFLSIVFLYQNYPRRGVMRLLWYTVDIFQYFSWVMTLRMLLLHVRKSKSSQ